MLLSSDKQPSLTGVRALRLYKRVPVGPDPKHPTNEWLAASWYMRVWVRGKPVQWSCKTADHNLAMKRALNHRDLLIAEKYHLVDAQKARHRLPTFASVIEQYEGMRAALAINQATAAKNIKSLRLLLANAGLSLNHTVDCFNRKVAIKWQNAGAAKGTPASTINSRHRCAASIFSANAMLRYDPPLPAHYIDDFRAVPLLPEEEKLRPMPSPETVALAHEKLPAHPQHYRAFLLGAYGGLRSSEIIAATWGWLEGDVLVVGGREFATKSGKWRAVRLPAFAVAAMGDRQDNAASLVGDGAKTIVQRGLPSMLKALGFDAPDPVHSLRRWFGSQVAHASGIHAAKDALGHSSVTVTERHYARLLSMAPAVSAHLPGTPAQSPAAAVPVAPAPEPPAGS